LRRSFTLLAVAACGIVPRVLLLRLPGLGRDEAAYLYWSHDPEFAYSPLLQVALWFADALPGAAAWTLRLPALVGGVAALVLARRLAGSARQPAVVALFLSPWWVFSSSMVHPDALLLPALLALCLARRRGHAFGVAVAASLAAWAKPSGLLAIPVALVFLADPRLGGPWRRLNAALLALSAASVVAPILRPEIFSSLREFASADPTVAWQWRWGIGLLAVVLLTGPHMLAAAVGNAWRARGLQLEALLPTVFAAAFAFAALFWGQFKITWFLPAIVLWTLLPTTGRARAASAVARGLERRPEPVAGPRLRPPRLDAARRGRLSCPRGQLCGSGWWARARGVLHQQLVAALPGIRLSGILRGAAAYSVGRRGPTAVADLRRLRPRRADPRGLAAEGV
jgi:hypothetical protein